MPVMMIVAHTSGDTSDKECTRVNTKAFKITVCNIFSKPSLGALVPRLTVLDPMLQSHSEDEVWKYNHCLLYQVDGHVLQECTFESIGTRLVAVGG